MAKAGELDWSDLIKDKSTLAHAGGCNRQGVDCYYHDKEQRNAPARRKQQEAAEKELSRRERLYAEKNPGKEQPKKVATKPVKPDSAGFKTPSKAFQEKSRAEARAARADAKIKQKTEQKAADTKKLLNKRPSSKLVQIGLDSMKGKLHKNNEQWSLE